MEHIQKYVVGTFDDEPASQPFPPQYDEDRAALYKSMLGDLEPQPSVGDHGSTVVRRHRLRAFWHRAVPGVRRK